MHQKYFYSKTHSEIFITFGDPFWDSEDILGLRLSSLKYSAAEVDEELVAVAEELIVLKSKLEHLNASSKASIQHFPAALFGVLNIK